MKTIRHQYNGPEPVPTDGKKSAFTLIELLVVIATLAVLAMVMLPALAGVQNKGGRAQCANNLRQIGVASMVYANEYGGWLPICSVGAVNNYPIVVNRLNGVHYTRFVFTGTSQNSPVPTNAPLQYYQNLGYLFQAGLAGNGNTFFCPAQWSTVLGANYYTPLLTTDASGAVRSSYAYNPRIINPATGNILRRYQTTSQLEPHKLFVVDYFEQTSYTPGVNPASIPHARERGWNVLFTDGGVQFSQNAQAYFNITHSLTTAETTVSYAQYDWAFNKFELDH